MFHTDATVHVKEIFLMKNNPAPYQIYFDSNQKLALSIIKWYNVNRQAFEERKLFFLLNNEVINLS